MNINSLENKIYELVEEYFHSISAEDLKPSNWKVPIGGGYYDENEVNAALKCYLHGSLSIQNSVVEFENAFSSYIGNRYGIACNSGTQRT